MLPILQWTMLASLVSRLPFLGLLEQSLNGLPCHNSEDHTDSYDLQCSHFNFPLILSLSKAPMIKTNAPRNPKNSTVSIVWNDIIIYLFFCQNFWACIVRTCMGWKTTPLLGTYIPGRQGVGGTTPLPCSCFMKCLRIDSANPQTYYRRQVYQWDYLMNRMHTRRRA